VAFLRDVFGWDVAPDGGVITAIDTGVADVQPNDIYVAGSIRRLAPGARPRAVRACSCRAPTAGGSPPSR